MGAGGAGEGNSSVFRHFGLIVARSIRVVMSYFRKGFDNGENLNFFAYPSLWAIGLGWSSMALRNASAGD